MRSLPVRTLVVLCLQALTATAGAADLIAAGEDWRYFKGTAAPSDPADAWKDCAFDDSAWPSGPSGFGYGDNDDAPVLGDMKATYKTVYTVSNSRRRAWRRMPVFSLSLTTTTVLSPISTATLSRRSTSRSIRTAAARQLRTTPERRR